MRGFIFLLVILLLFCESTACSKALGPLLFYLVLQGVIHSYLCSVVNRAGFALSLKYSQLAA